MTNALLSDLESVLCDLSAATSLAVTSADAVCPHVSPKAADAHLYALELIEGLVGQARQLAARCLTLQPDSVTLAS